MTEETKKLLSDALYSLEKIKKSICQGGDKDNNKCENCYFAEGLEYSYKCRLDDFIDDIGYYTGLQWDCDTCKYKKECIATRLLELLNKMKTKVI